MRRSARLALMAGALACVAATEPAAPPRAGAGYVPTDLDERGLWMQAEEYERELKHSAFVMRDPALNAYVRDVFCKTVGQAECKDVRIYLMRTPYFNASMAPNGLMQVYSGLFLRVRNEAQMAAILGHEYTHYRNRHSVLLYRNAKKNFGAAAFLGGFGLFGSLIQLGMIGSVFSFSRENEAEADAGSIPMLAQAGYDPHSASQVWEQLRAEMDATAIARKKKSRKDKTGGMFGTHPPSAERMAALKALADKQAVPSTTDDRRAQFIAALKPFWADFVDDQIKLNDFGGTEFLLESLAKEGWTPDLLYARGELYRARGTADDLVKAAGFYREALTRPDAPVEAHRGLGLALLRGGSAPDGRAALKVYLEKLPDAPDRAMIAMLAGG